MTLQFCRNLSLVALLAVLKTGRQVVQVPRIRFHAAEGVRMPSRSRDRLRGEAISYSSSCIVEARGTVHAWEPCAAETQMAAVHERKPATNSETSANAKFQTVTSRSQHACVLESFRISSFIGTDLEV